MVRVRLRGLAAFLVAETRYREVGHPLNGAVDVRRALARLGARARALR